MRSHRASRFFLISILISLCFINSAVAATSGGSLQSSPNMVDARIMDVNQIDCYIQNNGKIGENPQTGGNGFYYPKGQRYISMIFTGGLWVLGMVDGELRTACSYFATEYQPGIILPNGRPDDATKPEYRIYTFNKGDVVDQAALDQGCPSEVLGDRMMFCVFNDMTDHANVFTTLPIGLEVSLTAFGFNRPGALGNTLFFRYRFTNKSSRPLDSAFVAMAFDPDNGDGNDDYIGCDTTSGVGYVFNGDNYDTKYGSEVPALGCDFFQGPIVDAPGETAVLPDGTVLTDKRILPMTSFLGYDKHSGTGMGDPSLYDPRGGQMAYDYANGVLANGEPWLDPATGLASKFPYSGDPVLNTGWLMSSSRKPRDVRMGVASGPFMLAPNDTKEIVIGLIVGQGSDHLSSISLMKHYDRQAQAAFDSNFDIPSLPPVPRVSVAQDDGEIMLIWDKASSEYSSKGYEFEGYNIWQAGSAAGPWVKVATIDRNNQIKSIVDDMFDADYGTMVRVPVQEGTDSGLRYNFFVEKDYLTDKPLVNGRKYFFAVTGYVYNPDGIPRTIETPRTEVTAMPQKPVLDTEYNTTMRDTIPAALISGISDGKCVVTVVDPAAITGHEYEVSFSMLGDSLPVWNLTDKTTGQTLLAEQREAGESDPEKCEVVDGLTVKVTSVPAAFKAVIEVANEAGPLPQSKWDAAGKPFEGDNVWHALSPSGFGDRHYVSAGGGTGGMDRLSTWIDYAVPRDFEIRFTDAGGWAVFAFENDMIATTPFELWDIGIGTTDDTSDDVRMIPFLSNSRGETRAAWSAIADVDPYSGYQSSDWIYWMDPQDANGYARFADVCAAAGAGKTYPRAADGSEQGYFADFHGGFVCPIGEMIICDYDDNGLPPLAGTVIRVLTGKTNSEDVKFAFSTAGLAKERSAAIARKRLDEINVFPNPYFGSQDAERGLNEQFVTFSNLPEECRIRIFTLSGQPFRILNHVNGTPFERWDLRTENGLPIGSAMYLAIVETAFGKKVLKLGVINRESRYLHM